MFRFFKLAIFSFGCEDVTDLLISACREMERWISHLRLEENLGRVSNGFLLACPRLNSQLRDVQVSIFLYAKVVIISRECSVL